MLDSATKSATYTKYTGGATYRISINSLGEEGNTSSWSPLLSADGQIIAFVSDAENLVFNDTNDLRDVFVHDIQTGETRRVSISINGEEGNAGSYTPNISADGRYVAFRSAASNLVDEDTNNHEDVFLHDVATHQTYFVSINSTGQQGVHYSRYPSLSANGRLIGFESWAVNMVPDDSNRAPDVYLRDRGQ